MAAAAAVPAEQEVAAALVVNDGLGVGVVVAGIADIGFADMQVGGQVQAHVAGPVGQITRGDTAHEQVGAIIDGILHGQREFEFSEERWQSVTSE